MGDMILYRSTNGFGSDMADLKKYKVMSVVINEEDSNPGTSCTYADDAVDMVWGATDEAIAKWQEFFQYRPCLFAGGELRGYLNPNDYTKFENGSPSGVTSSNIGVDTTGKHLRVAIEIPKMGFCISRSGNTLKVSVTNYPNKEGYNYKAFLYNGTYYDHLYVDAGVLTIDGSSSNITLTAAPGSHNQISVYRLIEPSYGGDKETLLNKLRESTYGDNNRHFLSFYENMLLQCMSILQLKSIADYCGLFEDDLLGDMGIVALGDNSPIKPPSLFYRDFYSFMSSNDRQDNHIMYCMFGITNFHRVFYITRNDGYQYITQHGTLLDGIIVKNETTVSISTNGTYSSGWGDSTGYKDITVPSVYLSGITNSYGVAFVKTVYGDNEYGFIPKTYGGSSSTYWSSSFSTDYIRNKDVYLPFAWTSGASVYRWSLSGRDVITSNIFNIAITTVNNIGNRNYDEVTLRATTLL